MLEWQSEKMRCQSIEIGAVVSAVLALLLVMPALAQENSAETPCESLSIGITKSARVSLFLSEPKCRKQAIAKDTPIGNGEIVYTFSPTGFFRLDFLQLNKQHFADIRPDIEQHEFAEMANATFKDQPISWGHSEENSGWRLTYFGFPKVPILRCVGFAMYRDLRFGEPGYHKRFLGFYCTTLAPSSRKSSSLTDDEIDTLLAGLIIPP
jgi:hypothetical protein